MTIFIFSPTLTQMYTVKLHYLQKYWIEAHQIYMRYRRTVAGLNAPIDISIIQYVAFQNARAKSEGGQC